MGNESSRTNELIKKSNSKNNVISVSTLWYKESVELLLDDKNNFIVELINTLEHIFERLIFCDENDQVLPNSKEYRDKHRDHYMHELYENKDWLWEVNVCIKTKIFMDNQPPKQVVEMVYQELKNKR